MPSNRRHFLSALTAGFAGMFGVPRAAQSHLAPAPGSPGAGKAGPGLGARPTQEPTSVSAGGGRILVVGAGLAGLATAARLVRGGREVVVLEAEPKMGGRALDPRQSRPLGRLVAQLARGLDVRTGVEVTCLRSEWGGVVAETNLGDFEASSLVLTLPPEVIAPTLFRDALPRWKAEAFARGSLVGAVDPSTIGALAAPIGRIRFAGDATELVGNRRFEGALRSARREADQLLSSGA